ncbi:unnamed protein product [Laminaria digitata]
MSFNVNHYKHSRRKKKKKTTGKQKTKAMHSVNSTSGWTFIYSTACPCSFPLSLRTSEQGHLFCYICLNTWANTATECPSCRRPFLSATKITAGDMEVKTNKKEPNKNERPLSGGC